MHLNVVVNINTILSKSNDFLVKMGHIVPKGAHAWQCKCGENVCENWKNKRKEN